MKRILIHTVFFLIPILSFAQFGLFVSPLTVKASYNKEDSSFHISYQNQTQSEIALWIGDFYISTSAKNKTENYLANPIKNSLFLFDKNKSKDRIFNYFFDYDTSKFKNKSNYKLLLPGEYFQLIVKDEKFLMINNKRQIRGYIKYSIIDIGNLCTFLINEKLSTNNSKACYFEGDRDFFPHSELIIINENGKFSPKIGPPLKNTMIAPEYYQVIHFSSCFSSEISIKMIK